MSKTHNKPLAQVIGTAVATGTLVAGSMFSMQAMASGYASTDASSIAAEGKCGGEGKCGEGKCGGDKAKRDAASGQASGKRQFAAHDTDGDGFISQAELDAHHAKKSAEGKCGEGKCGEGKCGGSA